MALTLAESCFAAKGLGADIKLKEVSAAEYALFGERGARAVVSVAPDKLSGLLTSALEFGVRATEIGKVTSDNALRIQYNGRTILSASIDALKDVWANSLERALKLS